MQDWQTAIIASLLTFVATLTVAWLGFRQSTKQRREENRRAYSLDRLAVHRELWGLIESIHLKIRTARPTEKELQKLDQELNAFRLRNGIYLERDIQDLSNEYFNALVAVYSFLVEQGVEDDIRRFETTLNIPHSDQEAYERLSRLQADMEGKRDLVITRIKEVLMSDAL